MSSRLFQTLLAVARYFPAMASLGLAVACTDPVVDELSVTGDRRMGRDLILQAGCGSCHRIPGIASAQGRVGPPLTQFARRGYLAGVIPNKPEPLVRWLMDPGAISPQTAMPDTGITKTQAKDIAAYLYQPD